MEKFESKILNVTIRKPKIHLIPDVVYSQAPTDETPNQLLQMDLLVPQSVRKMPAIIFVTGGGFVSSNRARMIQLRMYFAERNFVVASISYRTAPNSRFPQPVEDVKSAVRYLKANAQRFSVDADKVFLIGDSAGGYLVSFAAVTNGEKIFNVGDNLNYSSQVTAAVNIYGVSDLTKVAADFSAEAQSLSVSAGSPHSLLVNGLPGFGGADGGILTQPRAAAMANPLNYITKNSAPMLLMHGTKDSVVSPSQTDLLFQALKSHGVEAERCLIPNADHSDEYWCQDEVFELIEEFLRRYL